jgi:hypothetical protein
MPGAPGRSPPPGRFPTPTSPLRGIIRNAVLKGHLGIDPDSEIITATTVTAGNAGDASVAEDLITDLLGTEPDTAKDETGQADDLGDPGEDTASVYGDNAYGTGPFQEHLEQGGIESKCKTQQPTTAGGLFTKDQFDIDLDDEAVTCPAGHSAPIRRGSDGAGTASFAGACTGCPLREQCTNAAGGRSISVGPHERQLTDARTRQRDPDWVADYRATRPKVERKIGHLMRRRHGGRRARVRGKTKLAADFALLAAAVNLARLAMLAVACTPGRGWTTVAE